MKTRRQHITAGLLVAVLLASPVQAAAPRLRSHHSENAATYQVFVPYLTGAVNAGHDLSVSKVEVVQGVGMSPAYTVQIAERPALVRVYAMVSGASEAPPVSARLTHYQGDTLKGELWAGPLTPAASAASQGDLTGTFNFNLPADWTTAGSSYVVEIDPGHAVPDTNQANNRYPAVGSADYGFTSLAPLEVVIVPIAYQRPGGTPTLPPLTDLSYLTWLPGKVLPLSQITYTVRSTPLVFTGDLRTAGGWSALLAAVDAVRAAEDPTWNKLYYGLVDSVVADACTACYAGLGYVNSQGRTVYKTSVGYAGSASNRQAASLTFTHEMGHNFGRRHAPCASPPNVDTAYPYANGAIGQWGYDLGTGSLRAPTYRDYMSYCGPEWTSDYTYHGIAQAWGWLNNPFTGAAAASSAPQLVVSGYVGADGVWEVGPVFEGSAPAQLMPGRGTHRVELLNAAGQVLRSVPFDLAELALDGEHDSASAGHTQDEHDTEAQPASFRVVVPGLEGLAGFRLFAGDRLVYERLTAGHTPGTSSAAAGGDSVYYQVRFSPDGGAHWHLLAHAAASPTVEVPEVLLAGAITPLLEIQTSDGVRSERQVVPLAVP